MARSDSPGAKGGRSGRVHGQTVDARPGARLASLGSVESLLRTVVAGSGVALVGIALWHVVVETGLATLAAALGSDTAQWVAVVLFGCALIAAAGMSRPSSDRHG